MKKVLIVGKDSYVGNNFKEYCNSKYRITELDARGLVPCVNLFKGIDVVFFVAGIVHRQESKENTHLYYEINRDLAVETAKASKIAGVNQFIMMSTMAVYGTSEYIINSNTKPNPVSNYGKSKYQAEIEIKKLESSSFKVVILRPPMIYGWHCKGNYQTLRKYALSIKAFPNYNNERSMLYIKNLASVIEHIIDLGASGTFFPQDATYTKTYDMVKEIAKSHGKKLYNISIINPIIDAVKPKSEILKKVFGTLKYDMCMNVPLNWLYEIRNYRCIRETERGGGYFPQLHKCDKMDDKLVSIVMPVYNSEKYIAKSIESVQRQSYTKWELIVVNDGSTDGSLHIIEEFASKDCRIKLFSKTKNIGIAKARNIGIRKASGRYLAFLDSDDMWLPDKLEKQINSMTENGSRFSFTGLFFVNEDGRDLGYWQEAENEVNYKKLLKCNTIPTSSILIDMKRIGLFQMPNIKHEDYATWLNLLKVHDIVALGINEPLVIYRKTKSSRSGKKFMTLSWTWNVYHRTQNFGAIKSIYYLGRFSFHTISKYARRAKKRYGHESVFC